MHCGETRLHLPPSFADKHTTESNQISVCFWIYSADPFRGEPEEHVRRSLMRIMQIRIEQMLNNADLCCKVHSLHGWMVGWIQIRERVLFITSFTEQLVRVARKKFLQEASSWTWIMLDRHLQWLVEFRERKEDRWTCTDAEKSSVYLLQPKVLQELL